MRVSLPESVSVDLRTAGYGSRGLAYIVDFLIRWGTIVGVFFLALLLASLLGSAEATFGRMMENISELDLEPGFFNPLALIVFLIFVIEYSYPVFFEVRRNGVTPGKKMFGLRVVDEDGLPIGLQASAIRTVLLLVDLMPLCGFVGLISMLISKHRQRLGDLAARTFVVYDIEDEYQLLSNQTMIGRDSAVELPLELYNLLSDFLARRFALDPDARVRVCVRLAALLQAYFPDAPVGTNQQVKEQWLERALAGAAPQQKCYDGSFSTHV